SRGKPSFAWAIISSWIAWGILIISRPLQIAYGQGIQFVQSLGDRGVVTTDRTGYLPLERYFAELHPQCAVGQQAVGQQITFAQQEFDRFGRLDGTDDTGQHANDAGLRTGGNGIFRRRFGEYTSVAGRFMRFDRDGLAIELQDAAMGVRLAGKNTGIVDQKLGGKVVGPVDDEVIVGDDAVDICRRDPFLIRDDIHVRINGYHFFPGRFDLGFTDIGSEVDHLTLQIGKINIVRIGNTDCTHSGSCQVEGDRCAETAGADYQYATVKQLLLPFAANFFQNDMARVALYLGFSQHISVLHP